MYRNYNFPLNIFLVFEKTTPIVWSSKVLTPNSFYVYMNSDWFYSLNLFLKNELFFFNSTLVENSAVDCLKYTSTNKISFFFKKNRILIYYLYYFYSLKMKINFLINYNLFEKSRFVSIDKLYPNASWLERETSEMYGINYTFKQDIRKLLIDYTKLENPMLKDFPCEGFNDVFFNFFEEQVCFRSNNVVEL